MRHAPNPVFHKPLLQSSSRPSSGPSTPLAGSVHPLPPKSASLACVLGVCAAFLVALLLLRSAYNSATLVETGSRLTRNATDDYLREQGPLYTHSEHRCRTPNQDERVPKLELIGTWTSRSGRAEETPVTVATQLSLERLSQLRTQCRFWPYTLVAAVHIPVRVGVVLSEDATLGGATLKEAKAQLEHFHRQVTGEGSQGGCSLEVSLFAEEVPREEEAAAGDLYPFNAMRNRALQMVKTEAVLLLDADVLVGQHFAAEVGTPEGWATFQRQLETTPAIVLPAFQIREAGQPEGEGGGGSSNSSSKRGRSKAQEEEGGDDGEGASLAAVQAGKEAVVQSFRSGALQELRAAAQLGKEACLPVNEWAAAKDYVEMLYIYGCEPNVLMLREHMPWFDERFRGYGYDKLMEYVVMWHWGVTFAVHPRGYLIHHRHPPTRVKHPSAQQLQQQGVWPGQLLAQVTDQLQKHHYYPVTSFVDRCLLRPQVQPRRRNVILRRPE